MATVLSTKKLALNQKELLLNSGIGLVEYDSISIKFIDFSLENRSIKNAIFTSKNAVKAIEGKNLEIENCFCVGEKTSDSLKNNGFKIAETAYYGQDLANMILNKYPNENFTFFCGNKRRDEIPSLLRENRIAFDEIEVYKTSRNFQEFKQNFDGVLFFSPSAVKSFMKQNNLQNSTGFCIGKTTASEVKNHTENIVVATTPSIENVIVQVVKYLKY